jgi:hypothetical protein
VSLYFSKFQPGRLVGNLSYLVLWRFSSKKDGQQTDFKATPAFWLANVGVRPLIIADIRLSLAPEGEKSSNVYPVNSVPVEAIDTPAEFHEYGRLSCGGPFQGISLASGQRWVSCYNFHIPEHVRTRLVGSVTVTVEAKRSGKNEWKPIVTQVLEFGSKPFHRLPMAVGAGVESIPVYSRHWKERTC